MRLPFCRCDYGTVIKRTFRSAAIDHSEMTCWVRNCLAGQLLARQLCHQ